MNRHQVLTGATNSGDHCFAIGSVEGVHFTAYATGCDIVILASDFQRVQIIPGAIHGNVQVSCIDCCTDAGKIAASYSGKVCIFEPAPLLARDNTHKLDYQWYHTGTITAEANVEALSWNLDGSRLLTGGATVQMWAAPEHQNQNGGVEFYIEDTGVAGDEVLPEWRCVWQCRPATPVTQIKFSPDGLLFASVGKVDRLVKIWYENKKVQFPMQRSDSVSPKKEELNYSFIYIAHPRAVTGFQWRKTSKYMPRGAVANMLLTACKDNICRMWVETILPEDGLVDLSQLDPAALNNPMFHTHRHKNRFMQRLHHIRNVVNKRKHHLSGPMQGITPLPSTQSVHDFHKFGVHPNSVAPGFHFHLAASINPDTDIPLLPAMSTSPNGNEVQFVVHWLNNKELHFTLEAEKILSELNKGGGATTEDTETDNDRDTQGDVTEDGEDMVNGDSHSDNAMDQEPVHKAASMPSVPAGHKARQRRMFLKKSRSHLSAESDVSGISMSSATSLHSQQTESTIVPPDNNKGCVDALDHKIDELLRDWHQSVDMLYSIHPLDGSYLVWLIDWLDEYTPGSFRQVQVSFSSRIPHALPVGDAMTMSTNLLLYCNHSKLDVKTALKESESKVFEPEKTAGPNYTANAMGKNSPGQSDNMLTPNVLMLSKHSNGSLNLWQITFAETSRFSTILSVAHASRVSGHRFRANSAACHPVLPLLLTTSHHNVPENDSNLAEEHVEPHPPKGKLPNPMDNKSIDPGPGGFCSELILWRVDPVGPLSKSGGITELARINSPQMSSFSNVAWLPTLLPSSTLGSFSNSPSALFVASDGISLRVYQSVIDARTLLTEVGTRKKSEALGMSRSNSSTSSGYVMNTPSTPPTPRDVFNIVSQQSTSRPGCIIELQTVVDAKQDWQHIQLIHVFQEQLITGSKSTYYDLKGQTNREAIIDLQNITIFEEHFFLVVVEKLNSGGSVLHMWRIVIASQGVEKSVQYSPDTQLYQDPDEGEHHHYASSLGHTLGHTLEADTGAHDLPSGQHIAQPRLTITSSKVCTQMLELPQGIDVVYATIAAGHLSSSSIYPACFAPYQISTACSDGRVRFWHCQMSDGDDSGCDSGDGDSTALTRKFEWSEWEMMIRSDDESSIRVAGKPLMVSCAYNGRVAVGYRMGGIKTQNDNPESKFVNLCVSIYECESTGGSDWVLEDTIELKNICLPEIKSDIDTTLIYNNDLLNCDYDDDSESAILISPTLSTPAIVKTVPIPSPSTIHSVKKSLATLENMANVLKQKHLVQLDWVSTEDGSHILTVGVGAKIMLYAAVSTELAQASQKDNKPTKSRPNRGLLQKSKSMTVQTCVEEIRWMKIRSIDLTTADGLPPLPMHVSWVRDGILVVGMDNEMHVYSQWRGPGEGMDGPLDQPSDETLDNRTLTEQSLRSVASSSSLNIPKTFKHSFSSSSIKQLTASYSNMSLMSKDNKGKTGREKGDLTKSESLSCMHLIQDCGLFEASRLANPVLPQYHPKQLIELLNFGKFRRVKAILAHLVRCIAGSDTGIGAHFGNMDDSTAARQRMFSSPRPLSVAGPASPPEGPVIPEDTNLDYIEISSIPPLPLYALLDADKDMVVTNKETSSGSQVPGGSQNAGDQDYSALFAPEDDDDDLDDPFDNNEDDVFATSPKPRDRRKSSSHTTNINYFGPAQSRLLARHLTRTHLPGLSSLDQMYLLALADTVANTKVDLTENTPADVAVRKVVDREQGQAEVSTEGLDDCGLRYMLASKHHIYLLNTLPIFQRAQLQKRGLSPAILVWAFHSDSQDELLNLIPSMQKGEPVWNELRMFGLGWWVQNINTLRRCIEKVAKAAFKAKNEPLDAALYYLAMKKKTLVWGLFRSVSDQKMMTFFKNNFSEDRWRRAALKNAFALMGRQRFHHAAGFFILAGAIRDAIEVCLNKLNDLQLAIVIARLYESELDDHAGLPANMKRLLYEECLGCDANGENQDLINMHPDPFIRSMAYWLLKDYSAALGTLLETSAGSAQKRHIEEEEDSYTSNPSVFNFYNYLRTHPLLVRQQLAMTAADKNQTVLLSGFSRGGMQGSFDDEKNVQYIDRITPIERRLYFQTAHSHFKNGCPMLALEVLSELPDVIDMESDITKSRSADSVTTKSPISTGTLGGAEEKKSSQPEKQTSDAFDWSTPMSNLSGQTAESVDWGTPFGGKSVETSDGFDWGAPITKFKEEELDLSLDQDGEDDGDTKSDSEVERKDKLVKTKSEEHGGSQAERPRMSGEGDIMAQQLKFIACLKIMMEELSTLATGFEVDGGQLRYQLYIWLEREVDVLKKISSYGADIMGIIAALKGSESEKDEAEMSTSQLTSTSSDDHHNKPTLHEVIMAEKLDFEAKLDRTAKRKQWLKANQQLLRTLLSYSVLHGSCGGGLASVRMELILLLQELQQEKTQQQLLSPLPFPTTLPLLSASVASAKTVVADPIRHLQSMTQDILHTLVEFTAPPNLNLMINQVFLLRNLSAALSACIYQCLCDSDSFVVSLNDNVDIGMEGFTNTSVVYKDSYLMAGAQRRRNMSSTDGDDLPNSLPNKWPGVSQLRALLAREKDEDAPKLNILLCETLVAVYMCLLVHALAMYDANILYRLVAQPFVEKMWPALFGGGAKKLIKITTSTDMQKRAVKPQDEQTKQRMKLHMKVLGTGSTPKLKDDKPTYKEKFVPPEVSMISYFMTKPYVNPEEPGIDYDSAESTPSSEDEEEEEYIGAKRSDTAMNEHLDPNSYSWCLMRYSIVKYIRNSLLTFLPQIGIELPELPVCSPLLQSMLKTLEQWEEMLLGRLELFAGPPPDYVPGCYVDTTVTGPTIDRYKTMKDASNTPFLSNHFSSLPAKRLWHYLILQEYLQEVFIRFIFKRRKQIMHDVDGMRIESPGEMRAITPEPMKIIHKEQDIIASFCVNQANLNCISVATQKEVVEMDISGILNPPQWLEDETEYDIENIHRPSPPKPDIEEFLLVQTPMDKYSLALGGINPASQTPVAPGVIPAPTVYTMGHTGRGAGVLAKRHMTGVRRMGAHPHLPYYLTGSQDGSVRLWEWGHTQCIAVARQPGSYPKVSKVAFNAQGNKFGVSDAEGSLCLWQVGLGVNMNRPYLSLKCHNKSLSDFTFVGSSSLLSTAGHSSEGRNVCLWDTLLPQKSALVQGFSCHSDGSAAILYSPKHQLIISGGKRGDIAIIDVRQRHLRHTFQAHDAAIRCMSLDPAEEFFVSGSADGDIKVWALNIHNVLYSFPGEHSKNSIFRNMGSGVTQLHMSQNNHLFSCGADGSMKVRTLPDRDTIVNSWC